MSHYNCYVAYNVNGFMHCRASMRLAYQDMSIEKKKQEEKLKQSDPKKAEQIERLGMGGLGAPK